MKMQEKVIDCSSELRIGAACRLIHAAACG
jgi:hypothetical protein